MVLEAIAASLLELGEKIGRPLSLVLVGILIDGPRHGTVVAGKGAVEAVKMMANGRAVKRVEHWSLTARCGAFDGRVGRFFRNGVNLPRAAIGLPRDRAGRIHAVQNVNCLAIGTIGDERLQR